MFLILSNIKPRSVENPCNGQLPPPQDDLRAEESDGSPPTSLDIRLLVPRTSDGWVYLCDPNNVTVAKFPIYRIIFFARGNATSSEAACFAFTCAVIGPEKVSAVPCRENSILHFSSTVCYRRVLSWEEK